MFDVAHFAVVAVWKKNDFSEKVSPGPDVFAGYNAEFTIFKLDRKKKPVNSFSTCVTRAGAARFDVTSVRSGS